ncbi:MAG: putative Ig domain-containing protein, partial [Gemmatimonadota bacterium]
MCDVDWDGQDEQFNLTWLEELLTIIDTYKSTHNVPVSVNEFGLMRWIPDGDDFMDDEMDLFEQRGMNHALWVWDPSWEPWTEEVNAFNIRFGPNPSNTTDVESSDLLDVIIQYWDRNTVRPSGSNCQILLTSPNGSENWCVGESENILWTYGNTSGSVDIEYSTDGGSDWQSLVQSTSDDGSYSWTIPSTQSTQCLLRICDAAEPTCCDTSDTFFQICECGTIEITNGNLPDGTIGCPYDEGMNVNGGCLPYTWSVVGGRLPTGLNLDESSGTLSGVPGESGTFQFTIGVTDVLEDSDEESFSIQIIEYVDAKGDVNGDCSLDILDAVSVVNIILELTGPTEEEEWRADCNGPGGNCDGDGVVNILDVVKIVRLILGFEECL